MKRNSTRVGEAASFTSVPVANIPPRPGRGPRAAWCETLIANALREKAGNAAVVQFNVPGVAQRRVKTCLRYAQPRGLECMSRGNAIYVWRKADGNGHAESSVQHGPQIVKIEPPSPKFQKGSTVGTIFHKISDGKPHQLSALLAIIKKNKLNEQNVLYGLKNAVKTYKIGEIVMDRKSNMIQLVKPSKNHNHAGSHPNREIRKLALMTFKEGGSWTKNKLAERISKEHPSLSVSDALAAIQFELENGGFTENGGVLELAS